MKAKVLFILALLLTVTQGAWADLTIKNSIEWNAFANSVSDGNTYAGETVTLTGDLSVSRMAGTVGHPFSGTLEGQGHTLWFSGSRESGDVEEPLAPFAELSGATIKNLHIDCEITTNGKRPASLAGFVSGNSTITNCISYPEYIKSTMSGNICAGGFVGQVNEGKTLTMEGCSFAGTITYSDAGGYGGGGFVGYLQPGATVNFTNCVFAPESLSFAGTENNFHMFAGGDGSSTININNCYHNDVAAATTGISVQGKRAYRISAAYDVSMSISGDATATYDIGSLTIYSKGFKFNSYFYAAGNDVVPLSLSHADKSGYIFKQYTTEGGGSLNNPTTDSPTLTMANADQTINAEWVLTAINSTDDWNTFVNNVNEGNDYSGLTVSLNKDISGVTTMVGTSGHPFRGTFDGQLHTLTVNINATERNAAPFNHVDGATIQNLRTAGNVTSSNMDIAGIVANVSGNTTIRNCTSSIYLLSTRSADVDAGGIVSHVNDNQTVNVIGCSFTGRIQYSFGGNEGGGIVGWLRAGATANVTGCVFAPTAISISNWSLPFKMFVCGVDGSTTNINNCYYNDVAAAQSEIVRQGKQMRRITWASNMSMSFSEEGTKYNADYITCYSTGIHYQYWYYAGAGEEVPLTVTHFTPPEGYVWKNYTVTGGGTLIAQTETSATLLMADADQELGLEWIQAITLADNADNSTVISENNGNNANVTLSGRTLWKDGDWNTLTLPFALASLTGTPLEGATVRELDTDESGFNPESGLLSLYFKDATAIEAGKPYLVKWDEGDNITNPVFTGVTVSNVSNNVTSSDERLSFVGTFSPAHLVANTWANFYLGAGNTIYYPTVDDYYVRSCRAYFTLDLSGAPAGVREFIINTDEDAPTGIVESEELRVSFAIGNGAERSERKCEESDDAWYDLSGRKYNKRPTKPGLYIHKGKKVSL